MKVGHHFQAKQPSTTPKFCKQNFSRMHHVGDMNFLLLIAPIFEAQKTWFRNFEIKTFYLGGISMGPYCLQYHQSPRGNYCLIDFFRKNELYIN